MTRGNYQTRQQESVEALFASREEECLSVEDAYQLLSEQGAGIGKTTVYRAIARLCQAGRLRRYSAHERGESARYQYNPCTDSHLHIRCLHCGALAHLSCDVVEHFAAHLTEHHGFVLNEGQTILYGLCESCRSSAEK